MIQIGSCNQEPKTSLSLTVCKKPTFVSQTKAKLETGDKNRVANIWRNRHGRKEAIPCQGDPLSRNAEHSMTCPYLIHMQKYNEPFIMLMRVTRPNDLNKGIF